MFLRLCIEKREKYTAVSQCNNFNDTPPKKRRRGDSLFERYGIVCGLSIRRSPFRFLPSSELNNEKENIGCDSCLLFLLFWIEEGRSQRKHRSSFCVSIERRTGACAYWCPLSEDVRIFLRKPCYVRRTVYLLCPDAVPSLDHLLFCFDTRA